MDFNKITKKQLVLAALIVPILLVVIWAIRCQITSNKEYTIQRPIEKCHIGRYDDDGELLYFSFKNKDFSRERHTMSQYIVYEKDSDGFYYPDRQRIIPPLNKPFHTDTWDNGLTIGYGQSLWISYYINKAVRNGQSAYGTLHFKNRKTNFLSFGIDGESCSDNEACPDNIIESALNNYAEVLDSVENDNSHNILNYCNTAICDPENTLIYASVLKEKFDDYLFPCILYLFRMKKDDSEFQKTLIKKGKVWYKKYLQEDKYGNLQSAIQQLTSSYHWVNQENYKELYKIYYEEDDHQGTENKEGESIAEKDKDDLEGVEIVEITEKVLDRIDDEVVDTDSTYQKKIEKISEFVNFQGTPNPATISLIRFWTLRWKDGSAETIYNVLKNLNLE